MGAENFQTEGVVQESDGALNAAQEQAVAEFLAAEREIDEAEHHDGRDATERRGTNEIMRLMHTHPNMSDFIDRENKRTTSTPEGAVWDDLILRFVQGRATTEEKQKLAEQYAAWLKRTGRLDS